MLSVQKTFIEKICFAGIADQNDECLVFQSSQNLTKILEVSIHRLKSRASFSLS